MGINVPSLFGVIYKVDRTKDAKQFIEKISVKPPWACSKIL
jgi:hypothetical protein